MGGNPVFSVTSGYPTTNFGYDKNIKQQLIHRHYIAKSPSGWQAKKRVNDATTGDQFMPALDFDSTGNMTVTFYDRRDDRQNIRYHLYSARINSGGNRLEPNIRVSAFQSDPL